MVVGLEQGDSKRVIALFDVDGTLTIPRKVQVIYLHHRPRISPAC
jgi:hypothetical protein